MRYNNYFTGHIVLRYVITAADHTDYTCTVVLEHGPVRS